MTDKRYESECCECDTVFEDIKEQINFDFELIEKLDSDLMSSTLAKSMLKSIIKLIEDNNARF